MSYNPRIRNKRNNVIQVTGSVVSVTGAISAVGDISTSGIITGSVGLFTSLTASVISASQYLGLPPGNGSGDVNQAGNNTFTGINTFNTNYITASVGITGSDAKFTSITGTLNGLATNVLLVSTDTTLTSNNHVILASASLSNITITLPLAASSPYRQYVIKKTDSNSSKIIISGTSGQTIDGNLGREINTQYETVTLINNGISEWFIL